MIRTQISLNFQELSWLRKQAKEKGMSMAEVVRFLIHQFMNTGQTGKKTVRKSKTSADAVKKRFPFLGMCSDAPPSDAKYVDTYLYEEGEPL